MNTTTKGLHITVIIVAIIVAFLKLVVNNDELILQFGFTDTVMKILNLVAYLVLPLLAGNSANELLKSSRKSNKKKSDNLNP